jgi:DNA polymerase-4
MNTASANPVFFHADLDAFFASVEQSDNLSLKGKPVIVGATPGKRGVVSACSYEARTFGIRSAMPISEAVRKCPHGVYLPVRMDRYIEISNKIMHILEEAAPVMMQISIDEAFLDLTGTQRLLGPPAMVAQQLKKRIKTEFDISLSVGIASNKFLAKLASQYGKPDGLYEVKPGEEETFLDTMKPADLWGVGKKTAERLLELNITTMPALRGFPEALLVTLFGKACGSFLFQAVHGLDPGIFSGETKSQSISSETTFERDRRDVQGLKKVILALSHEVMSRLIEMGKKAKTVVLKIRLDNFETFQAQTTAKHWLCSTEEVYDIACRLLEKKWNGKTPLRLLGVGVANIVSSDAHFQPELFEEKGTKSQKIEEEIFKIRSKYSRINITKARLIKRDQD